MTSKIIINPVTRLEGHGKVTIQLDADGNAVAAQFHVTEFRGFEKFCEGRMLWEMPVITSRICGICPVSHHLASVKAIEALLGVSIPPAARLLRELMHMGQIINSHALHFFYLAVPDWLVGPDAAPETRNLAGLLAADPQLGQKAIRLRQIGQNIVERVGGRSIHPVTAIPGGMSKPLEHADRFYSLKELEEALELAQLAITTWRRLQETREEMQFTLGSMDSMYLAMTANDNLEFYDGNLRLVDAAGGVVKEFAAAEYLDYIGEATADYTYMKFPYYIQANGNHGIYRVGPLARLNAAKRVATPLAAAEFREFRQRGRGGAVNATVDYHYARIIELLYAVERARELLQDDVIVSPEVRVAVQRQAGAGVGALEAPRGTLLHHYWADDLGKVEQVNIIVSTAHNNAAINHSVNQVARELIRGGAVQEGLLNRVEMAIRCYDPCLSCATHRIGQMPLLIELYSPAGELVDSIRRDAS